MGSSQPYLSIVIPSRNDDYAGGIVRRLNFTLSIVIRELNQFGIDSEIVLVDWNYDPARPRLKEAIAWPSGNTRCAVRAIEVGPEYHRRYRHWQVRAIQGGVGTNVGVRRAHGVFCVPRVSDSFWSEPIYRFLSSGTLDEQTLYRCDRVDVSPSVLDVRSTDTEDVYRFCTSHTLRRNCKLPPICPDLPALHTNGGGDFLLMSSAAWNTLRGYQETTDVFSVHGDGLLAYCAYAAGIQEKCLPDEFCVYKVAHQDMFVTRARTNIPFPENLIGRLPMPGRVRERLTALSRRLVGNPTLEICGVELPTFSECTESIRRVLSGEAHYVLNGPDWGLGNESLPEFRLQGDRWVAG